MTEDEMAGWHHRLNGHEFEQAPGDDEGRGGLVCCGPWGCRESDTTERLNNSNKLCEAAPDRKHWKEIYQHFSKWWDSKKTKNVFLFYFTASYMFYDRRDPFNNKEVAIKSKVFNL